MKYQVYHEMIPHLARMVRITEDEVISLIPYDTLDALVLLDETTYKDSGRRVYVPEDLNLIRMIRNAKISVRPEDLAEFPPAFSFAWPKGTDLPSPLIRFNQKDMVIHMVYPINFGMKRSYIRFSADRDKIMSGLVSGEPYNMRNTVPINEEERKTQQALFKLVLGMLVYMTAMPDKICDGWPVGVGSTKITRRNIATTIGGTHCSPESHWRNAHFRSYPVRKNGERKNGIVFVRGTVVNMNADPKTVLSSRAPLPR